MSCPERTRQEVDRLRELLLELQHPLTPCAQHVAVGKARGDCGDQGGDEHEMQEVMNQSEPERGAAGGGEHDGTERDLQPRLRDGALQRRCHSRHGDEQAVECRQIAEPVGSLQERHGLGDLAGLLTNARAHRRFLSHFGANDQQPIHPEDDPEHEAECAKYKQHGRYPLRPPRERVRTARPGDAAPWSRAARRISA